MLLTIEGKIFGHCEYDQLYLYEYLHKPYANYCPAFQ